MPENILPCLFWSCIITTTSMSLIEKEDIKYKLSNKLQLIVYLISIIFSICFSFAYPKLDIIPIIAVVGTISALTPSMIIDFKFQELPNRATGFALLLALFSYCFLFLNDAFNLWSILSVVIGFILLFFLMLTGNLGGGDVKMSVPLMIILQTLKPLALVTAFAYSLVTALIFIAYFTLRDKIKARKEINKITEDILKEEQTDATENVESKENVEEKIEKDTIENYKDKHLFAFGPFLIIGTMLTFFIILI